MFLVSILLTINIKKLLASENDGKNMTSESINSNCIEIDYLQNKQNDYEIFKIAKERSILSMIFECMLENLFFPLQMQSSWPKEFNGEEYEITKGDLDFDLYIKAIYDGYNIEEKYSGKNKAIYDLINNLADRTRIFFVELICMDRDLKKLNIFMIKKHLDEFVDIELDKDKNLIIKQIFEDDDVRSAIKNIKNRHKLHINILKEYKKKINMSGFKLKAVSSQSNEACVLKMNQK
ncbi:uncharacterized protein VNE69_01089 [Vairimorpha necatrix]|uniref:Uncharacterized protein n=1 Tax=Vairimorpha necatrix TaxID=6039 RepID=A0AAX4J876_9MICR